MAGTRLFRVPYKSNRDTLRTVTQESGPGRDRLVFYCTTRLNTNGLDRTSSAWYNEYAYPREAQEHMRYSQVSSQKAISVVGSVID